MCAPPRTAIRRSWSRAKRIAAATSSAVSQRAISAGRLSIIALKSARASSYRGSSGPISRSPNPGSAARALSSAEVKRRLAADAAEPGGGSPGDLAAYLKTDYERWGKVVKASGIRAN